MPDTTLGPLPPPTVIAFAARERARELLKRSFPRRRGRLILVRTRAEALTALRQMIADAVIVDLAQA